MAWTVLTHVLDGDTYRLDAINGTDQDGRPMEMRSFQWAADDERWFKDDGEPYAPATIAKAQRDDAKAQMASENTAPAATGNTDAMPGEGKAL